MPGQNTIENSANRIGDGMEDKKSDILIVGGGMIGLFCAYYLAGSGKTVRILDQGRLGEGASHGNCGLLLYSDLPPLCSPGTVQAEIKRILKGMSPLSIRPGLNLPLWNFLYRFSGFCNDRHLEHAVQAKKTIHELSRDLFHAFFGTYPYSGYQENGVYAVCRTRAALEKYAASNAVMARFGFGGIHLSEEELLEREPALKKGLAGGFYHDDDSHVRPDGLIRHMRQVVESQGVAIDEFCQVTGVSTSGRRISSLQTTRGSYRADAVVIAAGAWSVELMKHLDISIPVQPGKGYSITMTRPGVCLNAPCMLYERSVVATPFPDGFRLGGTMEFSGWDASINRKRLNNLRKAAPEYLNEPFGEEVVEEWAGFRPMSVDDLPIISRVPGNDNTLIATGHGMLGITLATGTGKLVTQMLEGKSTEIDTSPFSIDRFNR